MDAFDRPAKPEPKAEAEPVAPWARIFIGKLTNRWCAFDHPKAGRVAGLCTGAIYAGLSEPGSIPDFKLRILGRSKTQRNEITINLVESKAQFFDTETDAVNETL